MSNCTAWRSDDNMHGNEPKTGPTRYDLVPYPGYTHPQTHPDRLAVVGTLFGLEPTEVGRCCMLELGCGNGGNLVPMAWGLPGSKFVGIDLAAKAIAHGQKMIKELGLTNIQLIHGNITEINDRLGKFDYIVAHGVFSWIPAEVREVLLALCRRLLAPQGVAFVSYNALPGGHLHNMVREMMLFHVRGFDSPDERVKQAVALVRFLAEAQDSRDEYGLWLKAELESILGHEEGHLYHDELADVSQPFYFTSFVEKAATHGLQYLGEADYFEMFDYGFKESVRQTLERLGSSRILREQYLDFLKCRRFRQTLLCHKENPLNLKPASDLVTRFLVSSAAKAATAVTDFEAGATRVFETPKGAKCATDFAAGKAALGILGKVWPLPLPFHEVLSRALADLQPAVTTIEEQTRDRERLAAFFLELYSAGVVEFRTHMPRLATVVSERPVASPVARWQIQCGTLVTSQFHIAVKVEDEIGRHLLSWLDGTHDHGALLEKVWLLLKSKNALVLPEGDEVAARRQIESDLDRNLQKLARLGLLVG